MELLRRVPRGSGGGPFRLYPYILTTADDWFRADHGITLNGSTVSAWAGRNGNVTATQSTEANQPTYTASAIGGRPGLTFDGDTDALEVDGIASAFNGTGKAWTVFMVVQVQTIESARILGTGSNSSSTPLVDLGYESTNGFRYQARDDSANLVTTIENNALDTDAHILVFASTGSALDIRKDGTLETNDGDVITGAVTINGARIGAAYRNGSESQHGNFVIAEMAVFGSRITDGEIEAIESYASTRYGI